MAVSRKLSIQEIRQIKRQAVELAIKWNPLMWQKMETHRSHKVRTETLRKLVLRILKESGGFETGTYAAIYELAPPRIFIRAWPGRESSTIPNIIQMEADEVVDLMRELFDIPDPREQLRLF